MPSRFARSAQAMIKTAARRKNTQTYEELKTLIRGLDSGVSGRLTQVFTDLIAIPPSDVTKSLDGLPKDFVPTLTLAILAAGEDIFFIDIATWLRTSKVRKGWDRPPTTAKGDILWLAIQNFVLAKQGKRALDLAEAGDLIEDFVPVAATLFKVLVRNSGPYTMVPAIDQLEELHTEIFELLFACIDARFTHGLDQISRGKEPVLLRQLSRALVDIAAIPAIELPRHQRFRIVTEDNRSIAVNAFAPKRSRTYGIQTFDITDSAGPQPKRISAIQIIISRDDQLTETLRLFGQLLDPTDITEDNERLKRRRKSFAKVSKPANPLNHDGMVRIAVMAFLEGYINPDQNLPADAIAPLPNETADQTKKRLAYEKTVRSFENGFESTVALIAACMRAFTVHPGYDLDDGGPDYIATNFPLTLGGRSLHDCSVYAARIGYWLHAAENVLRRKHRIRLGLDTTLIELPLHVALLTKLNPPSLQVRPDGLPSAGIVLANNADIELFNAEAFEGAFSDWNAKAAPQDPLPTNRGLLLSKFYRSFAANEYESGLNMPARMHSYLSFEQNVDENNAWAEYKKFIIYGKRNSIFSDNVTNSGGRFFQFYLNYLEITTARSQFVAMELSSKFWSQTCRELYRKAMDGSSWDKETARLAAARTSKRLKLLSTSLDQAIAEMDKEIETYAKGEQKRLAEINKDFADNAKDLVRPGADAESYARFDVATFTDSLPSGYRQLKYYSDLLREFLGGKDQSLPLGPPPFTQYPLPDTGY